LRHTVTRDRQPLRELVARDAHEPRWRRFDAQTQFEVTEPAKAPPAANQMGSKSACMLASAMTTSPAASTAFEAIFSLSDDDLLTGTRQLIGRSNQLLARLLAHLGEVEARGIHRERACASLYTYCVHELRMSEDAAFRRARAAKFARQFPRVLEAIGAGELHLPVSCCSGRT
jgi:hypothetical protein